MSFQAAFCDFGSNRNDGNFQERRSFLIGLFSTEELSMFQLGFVFCFEAIEYPKIKILRFDESLYACNAPFFKRKFYELIGFRMNETNLFPCQKKKPTEIENKSDLKFVILDCSPFNYIDTVGVKLLIEVFSPEFLLVESNKDFSYRFFKSSRKTESS